MVSAKFLVFCSAATVAAGREFEVVVSSCHPHDRCAFGDCLELALSGAAITGVEGLDRLVEAKVIRLDGNNITGYFPWGDVGPEAVVVDVADNRIWPSGEGGVDGFEVRILMLSRRVQA